MWKSRASSLFDVVPSLSSEGRKVNAVDSMRTPGTSLKPVKGTSSAST
jgi:hypothetical protein